MENCRSFIRDTLYQDNGLMRNAKSIKTPILSMSIHTSTSHSSLPTSPITGDKEDGHQKNPTKRKETAERMRKWRALNKEKNKENDTRCRVYRVAKERFGPNDSIEKRQFIELEIKRRNERRRLRELKKGHCKTLHSNKEIDFNIESKNLECNLPTLDSVLNVGSKQVDKSLLLEPKTTSSVDLTIQRILNDWNFKGAQYVCKKSFL
ncbi:hypothetical protein K502DRAFT_325786 [Neoconidiobolus thromboides FSU 785]|nr:hypothetical protein K502DRAFT_325786 [Neoconidiobolus thromboides FSU 785]